MFTGVILFLLGCNATFNPHDGATIDVTVKSPVHDNLSTGIKYAMNSSLKVLMYNEETGTVGHGSGNYFKLGNKRFVLTAHHNVAGATDVSLREVNGNIVPAEVVYADSFTDMAILLPKSELVITMAVPYKINTKPDIVGQTVYFTSNPGPQEHILGKGFVSKSSHDVLILQSNAWYGSSGAVVFDKYGRVCGGLSGIVVGMGEYLPRALENYVVIQRYNFLTKDRVREILDG